MRTKNYVHKREREGREKDLLTLYATALCPTTRPNTMRIDLTLRAIRPTLLVKKILRYCLRERGCSFNGDTLCQVSGCWCVTVDRGEGERMMVSGMMMIYLIVRGQRKAHGSRRRRLSSCSTRVQEGGGGQR
jgi:hypothetical protein